MVCPEQGRIAHHHTTHCIAHPDRGREMREQVNLHRNRLRFRFVMYLGLDGDKRRSNAG
jgi:hypothetical protein